MTSAFTDEELKTLARVAIRTLARASIRPLEKRGKPYLYSEGKMIKARLFPQISACRKRRKLIVFLYSCILVLKLVY